MIQRIASLYRNADDTARARIFDRHDIGADSRKGREFDVDIFHRDGRSETASGQIGDVFYSRTEALEWIKGRLGSDVRPFRLPGTAVTYTHGWDHLLTRSQNAG